MKVHQDIKIQVLLAFWEKLENVTRLSFHAKTNSKEENGWNGEGHGEVVITKVSSKALIFNERGSWHNKEGEEFNFSNSFRWTLDKNAGLIALEHLRRGLNHPVFLFYLSPSGSHSLSSVDSHLCGKDTYFGQIHLEAHRLCLNWRVVGPQKNEELNTYYY